MSFQTLAGLAADLAAGRTSSRALTEAALAAAGDPNGEGKRVFVKLFTEAAVAEAEASDRLRAAGIVPSPLAGIPVSIKDLCDVAGQVTTAGSVVRRNAAPAIADAPVVARLRAAGAVIVGRTTMTEFAFSGLGLNPHYGTPRNPWDRATGRIPGGSSSGGAVSVTDGMAAAALGTDTGGSVRIPAALCGLTGFKPTARRVPTDGIFPLSWSLDSVGPLARSVACCALFDAVLAGTPPRAPRPILAAGLRLAVPQTLVLDSLDDAVSAAFQSALSRLSRAGAHIVELPMRMLGELPAVNAKGGLVAPEAFWICRELLAEDEAGFDPRVSVRMRRGGGMAAVDYIEVLKARTRLCAQADAETAPFDALLLPTTAIVAPPVSELERDDDAYHRANLLMLRNCSVGNFLDRCAMTLPCQSPGEAPVGLMVMGETMGDARLIDVAAGIEAALA